MLVGYPTSLVEGGHQDVCSTSSPTVQAGVKALEPETDRQTEDTLVISCDIISQAFEVDARKGLVVEGILRVRLRLWAVAQGMDEHEETTCEE